MRARRFRGSEFPEVLDELWRNKRERRGEHGDWSMVSAAACAPCGVPRHKTTDDSMLNDRRADLERRWLPFFYAISNATNLHIGEEVFLPCKFNNFVYMKDWIKGFSMTVRSIDRPEETMNAFAGGVPIGEMAVMHSSSRAPRITGAISVVTARWPRVHISLKYRGLLFLHDHYHITEIPEVLTDAYKRKIEGTC